MKHLSKTALYEIVFDQLVPTTTTTAHLANCSVCRQRMTTLSRLARELTVARLSIPRQEQLARYENLYPTT